MSELWEKIAGAAIIGGLLFVLGMTYGTLTTTTRLNDQIAAAHTDTSVCVDDAQAKQVAIDRLTATAADNAKQLDATRAIANAALDQRDVLQRQLAVKAHQRQTQITETAHADASCASLASLAVCPAVAERLWGTPASADSAAGH